MKEWVIEFPVSFKYKTHNCILCPEKSLQVKVLQLGCYICKICKICKFNFFLEIDEANDVDGASFRNYRMEYFDKTCNEMIMEDILK